MASKKLLNQRTVGYLFESLLAKDGPSKCHICTKQQARSFSALVNHNKQHQQQLLHSPVACKDSPQNGTTNNQHQQQQQHHKLQARLTSTTPTTTAAATTTTNIKRDASTQAQQQVVVDLNGEQDASNNNSNDNHQQAHHLRHQRGHHNQAQSLHHKLRPSSQPDSFTFRSSEVQIEPCKGEQLAVKPNADQLLFGHAFTDHMFRVDWDHETGWSVPVISKLHNLDIHPGAKVLHYALEAFEGAKAYRGDDNKIRFFRLDQNIRRLLHSSKRLSLPAFDENELIDCIHKLVHLEQDWIPQLDGKQQQLTSLYIRPTVMGVEPSLGVARSKKSILYVLLSPVGPYFKTGFKPISLYADPEYVRAWPGGAGNTKLGANYASTIMVQRQAEQRGLQQVLWLFGNDMKLTEVGTMNVFVTLRNELTGKLHLVTPPLTDGLILPGITRKSIIELARNWDDVVVEERYLTISEIQQLLQEKKLVEMFGAGTACIVCPISSIQMKSGATLRIPYSDITSKEANEGPSLTKRILKAITDIQYGRVAHPWAEELRY